MEVFNANGLNLYKICKTSIVYNISYFPIDRPIIIINRVATLLKVYNDCNYLISLLFVLSIIKNPPKYFRLRCFVITWMTFLVRGFVTAPSRFTLARELAVEEPVWVCRCSVSHPVRWYMYPKTKHF